MVVDVVDLILDAIFINELVTNGHKGWAVLLAGAALLAHFLDWLYGPVVDAVVQEQGHGAHYAYYFGTSECIIFLVEDTTTIYLFSRVPGTFDAGSASDIMNLTSTVLSALIVFGFMIVAGGHLIRRRKSASWLPNLALTQVAQSIAGRLNVHLGTVVSVFIVAKCIFLAFVIGFFAFITFDVVIKGDTIDGWLVTMSTVIYIMSIVFALALSLRSPIRTSNVELSQFDEDKKSLSSSVEMV